MKQGFDVAVYDKELYTGGKCIGTVDDGGVVHELTHRQFFAKNYNLINFLKEIPSESGSCLDSLYPQNVVQFLGLKVIRRYRFSVAIPLA